MPADAILAAIVVVAVFTLLYGPWQWACTDCARQILFERRDAIFDLATSGAISFHSKEYRHIRRSLESLIRFAHELSIPRFLLFGYLIRKRRADVSALTRALQDIEDESVRREIKGHVLACQRALLIMMFAKSPLFMFVLIILYCGKHVERLFGTPVKRGLVGRAAEIIQTEAEAVSWDQRKAA